jgi:hypothetical protein
MEQVWLHVAPTSERIIEDLEHLPDVMKKIIAHDGAVVPDEVLRSGRRALSEADRKKRRRARETRPHATRLALRER